MKTGVNYLVRQ